MRSKAGTVFNGRYSENQFRSESTYNFYYVRISERICHEQKYIIVSRRHTVDTDSSFMVLVECYELAAQSDWPSTA